MTEPLARPRPTLLLILDGWCVAPAGPGNALSLARTPNLDHLLAAYPRTTLACSGRAVGLPDGFMGNSEVGHMNIGAGRVVYQDMTRIDIAVEDGSFAKNPALTELCGAIKKAGGALHCMGLLSDGGVHSHVNHLLALLRAAKAWDIPVFVHAFLDGRDTPPSSGLGYVRDLVAAMAAIGVGRVATIIGRYYAMDRDKHFERNALAHAALVAGVGIPASDPVAAVAEAYAAGETDEFVKPRVLLGADQKPVGLVRDGDGIFFFNFRADRARQIVQSLFDPAFDRFERLAAPALSGFVTMTEYDSSFPLPAAFAPVSLEGSLGETVSALGLKQLRIAETEKYAHVTYFLNCGREEAYPGEERIMIPSPREVATYDLKPEMSCAEVTQTLLREWNSGRHDLIVCNLANLDMVGHTGIIPAVVKAAEVVDTCVGEIAAAVSASGGLLLLTADHGNAEEMIDALGRPQTAHSKNPVPLVCVCPDKDEVAALRPGVLGDIAPTLLALWGVAKPGGMSGKSLVSDGKGGAHG